jgi:AbrB family looped-hinge helix DNA binding protein
VVDFVEYFDTIRLIVFYFVTFKDMSLVGEQNMPLVKVKQNYQVTIPLEVREQLHIEQGDLLEATVEDDTVVLKPKVVFDRKSVEASLTKGNEEVSAGETVRQR